MFNSTTLISICKILILIIFFFSKELVLAEKDPMKNLYSSESVIFLNLWKQAREKNLYKNPYWLKLLHFYSFGESVGQWSSKSDIVSKNFFLSSRGREEPEEELKATLKALISEEVDNPDSHARCRFIARFKWLKSKLNFPKLKKINCQLFERWANLGESTGISIVFVSAYLKNPASTFGHLLLKFNSKSNIFGHSLLRPTLNFGAKVDSEENSFIYVLKGLFGGYNGIFSDERFYNFNHVYGENELRDLWEYPLNFSEKQKNRIIFHAWELLHNIKFKYYFFLDNCAYRMAELLEMAWDSDQRLNTSGAFWAIPIDVLFKLKKIDLDAKNKSLLGKPILIMSRQRKLQQRVSKLEKGELNHLSLLIEDFNYLDSHEFSTLDGNSKAKILDALIDYRQYISIDKPTFIEKKKEREKLLLTRSKLPIIETMDLNTDTISQIDGAPPMRFRIGSVLNSLLGATSEFGVWANYHDLLGDEKGHLVNAEVVTLDLQMQIREGSFYVSQFQLFNIQNYALNPTGIPGDFGWSWRAQAKWERENFGCVHCQIFRSSGGIGRSFFLNNRDLEYVLLEMFLETPKDSVSIRNLGLAPHIGMTWSPVDYWKLKIELGWFKSFYAEKKEYFRGIFDQRFSISQNFDFRFEIEHFKNIEGVFALHYYW